MSFHPPHRYDAAFRLKISPLLWIVLIHGLRHALFLASAGTPAALLLDSAWLHLQSTWQLLPSDVLVTVVLLASGHRVPGATPFVRRVWHAGRGVLCAAYGVDFVLFAVLRRDVLSTPSDDAFVTAVAVLAIDVAVLLFLARSRLVRDIFADFPEPASGQGARPAGGDANEVARRRPAGPIALLPDGPIVAGTAATAFVVPDDMGATGACDLGVRLHVEGRLADAEVAYRRALALDADLAAAWHGIGMLAVQSDRLDVASNLVGQAIRSDGARSLYHRNFGEICRRLGRVGEAIGAGHVATKLAPQDAEAHYNLALALSDGKRFDEAVESYRRALAIHPGHGAAWNNLGVLLKQRGDTVSARRAFESALAIDPAHRQAIINLESLG